MKVLKACIPLQNQIVLTCMKRRKRRVNSLRHKDLPNRIYSRAKEKLNSFSLNDEGYTSKGNLVTSIITQRTKISLVLLYQGCKA